MKAYVFLDLDLNLQYRSAEYIDNNDPGFWAQNSTFIQKVWTLETTNFDSIYNFFCDLRTCRVKKENVLALCDTLKINIDDYISK